MDPNPSISPVLASESVLFLAAGSTNLWVSKLDEHRYGIARRANDKVEVRRRPYSAETRDSIGEHLSPIVL